MKKEKSPWKTLNKNVIYDNPWIKVEHHDVLNPSGNEGIYGIVHFKNLAIGIIPVDDEGNTWLVGQYRYPLDRYTWEIPEGGGKLGTEPLASAKRELKEETGILAEKWEEIQRIHTSNSVSDELGIIYTAKNLSYEDAEPDEDEDLVIKKIALADVYQMILKGEITDSLSLVGIFKLKELEPSLFKKTTRNT